MDKLSVWKRKMLKEERKREENKVDLSKYLMPIPEAKWVQELNGR